MALILSGSGAKQIGFSLMQCCECGFLVPLSLLELTPPVQGSPPETKGTFDRGRADAPGLLFTIADKHGCCDQQFRIELPWSSSGNWRYCSLAHVCVL